MSDYRRWYVAGGTFFFTVVTHRRARFLCEPLARRLLREAMLDEQQRRPFEMPAIVLLPDHLHALWTLPSGDLDYSIRWAAIKGRFTRNWIQQGGGEGLLSVSKKRRERRGVWQERFIEHTIRDEEDLEAHFDYIHYNPVKHRLVAAPDDWEWSTFYRHIRQGHYPAGWGRARIDFPGVDEDLLE